MQRGSQIYWGSDVREEIGNALIVAQNALTGYFNLSNSPDTEQDHLCARMALDVVTEAIRHGRVLEQQGIVRTGGRGR